MKNWLKNFGVGVLLGFVVVFVLAWVAYTVFILKRDPALANAYVAVGTLILALVTSLLVILAWWNIRQTTAIRELDREERMLSDIKDWAEDVAKSAISRQTWDPHEIWKTKLDFKNSLTKSHYIVEVARSLFSELMPFIKRIIRKLEKAINAYTQVLESKAEHEQLIGSENELRTSVEKFLEEAAKVRKKL